MDEKKPIEPKEIADKELEGAVGGILIGGTPLHYQDGKCYEYIGTSSKSDWNSCFLCPHCERPVHYTGWGRFRCDACDESWFFQDKLHVNTESGLWEEVLD